MKEPELESRFIRDIDALEQIFQLMDQYKVNEIRIGECYVNKQLHKPYDFQLPSKEDSNKSTDPLDDEDLFYSAR